MPDLVTTCQHQNVLLPLFAEYPVFRCISQNLSPDWPISHRKSYFVKVNEVLHHAPGCGRQLLLLTAVRER